MRYIDYGALYLEVVSKLVELNTIVLATSTHSNITARAVSLVSAGTKISFQIAHDSDEANHIRSNPNIALAFSGIQIEATARICGHPLDRDNLDFLNLFKVKHPDYFKIYSNRKEQIVIKCDSKKISLFKLEENNAYTDVLDIESKIAYRASQT